jgi:hypothetical protein
MPDAVVATWPIWRELLVIGSRNSPSVFAGSPQELSGNEAGLYFTRHPGHTIEEILLIEEVVLTQVWPTMSKEQIGATIASERSEGTTVFRDSVHWEIAKWSIENEPLRIETGIKHSQVH